MSVTRDELLQVIADNPDDHNGWLLYADWLQQHGEPRGELIALDIAIESATGDRVVELEVARHRLLQSSGAALLGDTLAKVVASGYCEVAWRRGFVVTFGYVGNEQVVHQRVIGWLVKLIFDNPEPFTFVHTMKFTRTDLSDVTPFARFKHLVELDVRGSNVRNHSISLLKEMRPTLRVRGGS